jgi:hypothetical protein
MYRPLLVMSDILRLETMILDLLIGAMRQSLDVSTHSDVSKFLSN